MHDGETKPASMGLAQAHTNAPAHAWCAANILCVCKVQNKQISVGV